MNFVFFIIAFSRETVKQGTFPQKNEPKAKLFPVRFWKYSYLFYQDK